MKTPKRLTEEDRVVIAAMHKGGHLQKDIAATIGVSRSTISKELKRNRCEDGVYRMEAALGKTRARKKRAPYKLRGWLAKAVAARLRRKESPYSIGISLKEKGLPSPSIESIHRFVERDAADGGTLWIFLPLKRRRRRPHRKTSCDTDRFRGVWASQIVRRRRMNAAVSAIGRVARCMGPVRKAARS